MILVVTPLPLELEALRAAGLPGPRVRVEVGGHGKVQYALRTQSFIAEFKPSLVICAGACGGLSPEVRPLDVVVAEFTVEHDFKLRFIARPLPAFAGDAPTIALLKSGGTRKYGMHFGVMASGDEDIVDARRAAEIRKLTQAVAVAWEGAGGARACLLAGVPFLEIRGVTDSADHGAMENFRRNLAPAMGHVASVISSLL